MKEDEIAHLAQRLPSDVDQVREQLQMMTCLFDLLPFIPLPESCDFERDLYHPFKKLKSTTEYISHQLQKIESHYDCD